MGLETGSTISSFITSNPTSSDPVNQGDDHLRLIKSVLQAQFPGSGGLGYATAITATEAELNYVHGVTSNIQTQINNVASNANLTGAVTSVGNVTTVVTNANLTGAITSVGNAASLGSFTSAQLATALTDETGTGANVFATSPTLTTPTLTSATLTTPTINSAQVPTISGTAPLYMCRAWVNFNGTGTVAIRASGNVSYITDNGTGDYTVNFTTAMPDANYNVVVAAARNASSLTDYNYRALINGSGTGYTAAAIRVGLFDSTGQGGTADADTFCASIFR